MEGEHTHCVSCVNRRCMVRPEAGISCDLIGCPLVCGAVFHLCKAAEHRSLCALARTPCLNRAFGCPFTVTRNKMAAHLRVCPASVVCCTMEWNRWPVSYADRKSYENLSKEVDVVEQLDMALALQDQRMLLESLKAASVTTAKDADKGAGLSESASVASDVPEASIKSGIVGRGEESYRELYHATVETSRSLAAALDMLSNATKEMDLINGNVSVESSGRNGPFRYRQETEDSGLENVVLKESDTDSDCELGAVGGTVQKVIPAVARGRIERTKTEGFCESLDEGPGYEDTVGVEAGICRNGFHFAQGEQLEGGQGKVDADMAEPNGFEVSGPLDTSRYRNGPQVLDRSRPPEPQETPGSQPQALSLPLALPLPFPFPDLIPHDMLQQLPAIFADRWTERKLQDLHVLRGMSMCVLNGPRAFFASTCPVRVKTEDKSVDTSDLEVEDDPMGLHGIDVITAALLFCLGDSPGGRGISDSRFVDGYRVDFGTQTFSFPSAVLATSTMVGDIASASACDHANPQLSNPSPFHTLRLDLVLECVARYQTRQRSMFTFVCGQLFRRDEFPSHFQNVHADIHAGLNGWMEHRCPLAHYGCTYSQRRFCPSMQGFQIVHDRHLRSFGVQPCIPALAVKPGRWRRVGSEADRLSSLPFELLHHVASFLDGFSLCQLSRVSRLMRDVCASLLQERGMVVLLWEKTPGPNGSSSWQIKHKVWRFSTAFSTVDKWKFANIASMAAHLRVCQFNMVERRQEAVALPCMHSARELVRRGRSLPAILRPVL